MGPLIMLLGLALVVVRADYRAVGWQPLLRLGRGIPTVVPTRWDDRWPHRGPRVVANTERRSPRS